MSPGAILLALAVAGLGITACSSSNSSSSATTTTARTTTTTARATTTTAPPPSGTTPPPSGSGPLTSFGDGTRMIGTGSGDIVPGTYRTEGTSTCYWARLSGLGGTISEIITNENPRGPDIVTIEATDKAFESKRCGTWSPAPTSGPQNTSFGDGTWAVGIDIAPGTYKTDGSDSCYWARLSAFGASGVSGIIANENPRGPTVVTIEPTDKGFTSRRCGTWTKTG